MLADFLSLPRLNLKHQSAWPWGGISYSYKSVRKMPSPQQICKEHKQTIHIRGNTIKQIWGKVHLNSNQMKTKESFCSH